MSTPLPDGPTFNHESVAVLPVTAGPATVSQAHADAVAGSPIPAGYVLVAQANFDRMMELIVELQAERAADKIDHADYERLREKERVELLTPPPSFLKRQDFSRAMERAAE